MTSPDDFLAHYGVKGMKWGVRKDRVKKGRKAKRQASDQHIESRRIKQKKLSEMSNDEIATLNRRLQLERQYLQLNPNLYRQGRSHLSDALTLVDTVDKVSRLPDSALGKAVIAGAGKVKDNW